MGGLVLCTVTDAPRKWAHGIVPVFHKQSGNAQASQVESCA